MLIRRFRVEATARDRHGRAMRHSVSTALIALTLAGCATPRPAPIARPAPIVMPPPRPTSAPAPWASDWNDWPFTPGEWRYNDASASFESGGGERFTIKCQRLSHIVVLSGTGTGPTMTIRTTSQSRTMTGVGLAHTPDVPTEFSLAINDPLLDAIAFSRGRFVIQEGGAAPLVLPPHAEIGRVIEDCRG